MPPYDSTRFSPPAPLAQVTLRNPDSGASEANVEMLLDSGSDVTLIPREVADRLELVVVPGKRYELLAYDGSARLALVVRSEMVFCGRTFRGQFLLIDQTCGILGRNVLNVVPLLLDGPHLIWDEQRTT